MDYVLRVCYDTDMARGSPLASCLHVWSWPGWALLACSAGWVSRGRLWFIVTEGSAGPVCLAAVWPPFIIRLLLIVMFSLVLPFPGLRSWTCKRRLQLEKILKNNPHEGDTFIKGDYAKCPCWSQGEWRQFPLRGDGEKASIFPVPSMLTFTVSSDLL